MKKLWSRWIAVVLCCTLLSTFVVLPSTTEANGASTVTVDTLEVVNSDFLGIGAEYDPFHFMPESVASGYNDNWWQIEKRRLAKLQPNIVRMWYQIDWMEPDNDNNDPTVIDWSAMQTESVKMQSMYKVLDYLQEQNIEVMLVAGWKMSEQVQSWLGFEGLPKPETSAPTDLEEWAEWVSASVQQLIVNKGYTNIKYLMSYNEPNLGDFELPAGMDQLAYYEDMYRAIHERLVADGVRNLVQLAGPDESSGLNWLQHAAQNMDDILDMYDGHAYGYNYDTLAGWAAERMAYVEPTGKPLVITEFAAPGDKSTYQNGVDLADLILSGMRNNVSGMLLWRMADQYLVDPLNFLDSAGFGTWAWLPDSAIPRYTYYSLSLFTRFGGAHSQILASASDDSDLHVAALKRADGHYSVFVVNKSKTASKQLNVNFSTAMNKSFNRHVYSSSLEPTASATIIPSDASWENVATSFVDPQIPANSVVVYTSVTEPVQIEITPGDVSAALGTAVIFEGEMHGASNQLEWSVEGGNDYGTITNGGVYTAPAALPLMPQALIKAANANNPEDVDYSVVRFQVMGVSAFGDNAEAQLSWQPSLGASGYNVKRSETKGGPYTLIASNVNGTQYVDTNLANRQMYYYVVSAVNSYGEAADSKEVSVMPTSNAMQDNFEDGLIDPQQWNIINMGLRSTLPTGIEVTEENGVVSFEGTTSVNYWGGKTLQSAYPFFATPEKPLVVEVDRVSLSGTGTGQRSGLWLYVSGTEYLRFSQNMDSGVWAYNRNGGSDTVVFADTDYGSHTMKLVHDGTHVHVFVDGQEFTSVPVDWNSNMRVMLSAEARANGDYIHTIYDNLSVAPSESSVPAPGNLTAEAAASRVNLSWAASPGVQSYTVKRRTSASEPYQVIAAGITATQYSDAGLNPETTYDYVVSAELEGVQSLHSNSVSVMPVAFEVTIDNLQAEMTGTWTLGAALPGYYGPNYAVNPAGTGEDKIRWRPELPAAGAYSVYYMLPNGNGDRPTNAPYTVFYNGGSQTFFVNQQEIGGAWKLLGTFDFLEGTTGYVELTDEANSNYVIADAVRFVKAEQPPVLAVPSVEAVYSDSTVLRARLLDPYEAPIAGQTLYFEVNGLEVGSAVTDEEGYAELGYRVLLEVEVQSESQPYGLTVRFEGDSANGIAVASGAGTLTVSKEQALLAYTGANLLLGSGEHSLAARLHQLDEEWGELSGLPTAFTLWHLQPDFTWRKVANAATETIHYTNEQGTAAADTSLANGLYIVRSELLNNPYYHAPESALSFLIVKNSNLWRASEQGASNMPPAVYGKQKLDLKPYGVNKTLQISEWSWLEDGKLQGQAAHGNEEYTVQLQIDAALSELEVALKVWQGTDLQTTPIIDSTNVRLPAP